MDALVILAAVVVIAVAATLVAGWRDGWLPFVHRSPRERRPREVAGAKRANHVGIVEICGFQAIRRRIGFQSGNEILRLLARRIEGDGRFEIGRVGRTSIEFLYHADDAPGALGLLRDLRQALEQTVEAAGLRLDPKVVIGSNRIGFDKDVGERFDLSAFAVEDAYRQPERISLLRADELTGPARQSAAMLIDLSEAIQRDGLTLHYLPKLCLATGEIVGAEALSRWSHPRHGEVPPAVFIALAEETGLIDDLTVKCLDRAMADQQHLLDRGIELAIDVNLSGRLVCDTRFCELIIDRIASAPGQIGLEITETAAIDAPDLALANLQRLAAAGIRIALDDFGAGLSSLSYLRNLPAQELKIDQSFIRNLTRSNRDPLLVRSAIEIARALEMEVTAEGVEDELALSLLTVMRCNYVQGFHISRPLPLDQLIAFLGNGARPQATAQPLLLPDLQRPRTASA